MPSFTQQKNPNFRKFMAKPVCFPENRSTENQTSTFLTAETVEEQAISSMSCEKQKLTRNPPGLPESSMQNSGRNLTESARTPRLEDADDDDDGPILNLPIKRPRTDFGDDSIPVLSIWTNPEDESKVKLCQESPTTSTIANGFDQTCQEASVSSPNWGRKAEADQEEDLCKPALIFSEIYADVDSDSRSPSPTEKPCETCGATYSSWIRLQYHRLCHVSAGRALGSRGRPRASFATTKDGFSVIKRAQQHAGDWPSWKDFSLPRDYFSNVLKEDGQIMDDKLSRNNKELRAENDGLFRCKFCPEVFDGAWHLGRHVGKFHKDERRFECEVCGMCFSANCHLRQHIRTHSGEKPFHCTDCAKQFSQHSSLIVHQRTHSGEKPFVCEICQKGFAANSNLLQHIKIVHVGQKRNPCEICNRSFGSSAKLKNHLETDEHQRRRASVGAKT